MTQFKNLINIGTDFQKFPNAFFKIFSKNPNECFLLMFMIREFNKYNFLNKLDKKARFFLSYNKIKQECFENEISVPTIIKMINGLIDKKFIKKEICVSGREANYYLLNFKYINSLVGKPETVSDEEYEIEKEDKQETKIIEVPELSKQKKLEEEDAKVVKLWNEKIVGNFKYIPKLKKLNAENRKLFKARLKESGLSMEEFFDDLVTHVGKSTYLQGLNDHNWSIDFNWAMKPGKYSIIVDDIWRDKTDEEKYNARQDYIFKDL